MGEKLFFKSLLLYAILVSNQFIYGQEKIEDKVVQAYAVVTETPPKITIKWENSNSAISTDIYRKLKTEKSFPTTPLATVIHPSNSFPDNNIKVGVQYDYLLLQRTTFTQNNLAQTFAWGGVSAGIKVEVKGYKGKLLIVADTAIQNRISTKFKRFVDDLTEDGWWVFVEDKTQNDSVSTIKNKITNWYNQDKIYSEVVILLGDIPVPYSGDFGSENTPPDAHIPDHNGAWAADVYYGIINENVFTDDITNTSASREANKNYPNDGKFDQSFIPTDVNLQIGRIDMSNLNIVGLDYLGRTELYFDKNHAYRNKQFVVPQKYIFEDRLGLLGSEAPGRLHFFQRSLFEKDSLIQVKDNFFKQVKTTPCIWSGVTSSAGYTSINGVGKVEEFADSVYSVFSNYFGSYFGDWDNNNNFLRASIAGPGYTLTAVWDGRPMFHFHHMALGENIGFSLKHSQHNELSALKLGFYPGAFQKSIHLALMGDPTLRLHTIYPISNLNVVSVNNNKETTLDWDATNEQNIEGYWVYRSMRAEGPYHKISDQIITEHHFTDKNPYKGDNYYMVRTVKLESTPSGLYYNLSQGRRTFISGVDGTEDPTYINEVSILNDIKIFPNPSDGKLNFVTENFDGDFQVTIINVEGREAASFTLNSNNQSVNLEYLPKGVYFIKTNIGNTVKITKWIKIN